MSETFKDQDSGVVAQKLIEHFEEEDVVFHGEIEIGSYKSHVDTAKKGILEYKVWWSLNTALVSMARPNTYHRIDLRNKEVLKRMEQDLGVPIDYEALDAAILKWPYLIRPNGEKGPIDKTRDESGKALTKKAVKILAKKDKIQLKIDKLKEKYKKLKNKKGARGLKFKALIDELELKRDRI